MLLFPAGLNAEAAGNRKVVLQFICSGEVNATCHFEIDSGGIKASEGAPEIPDLTIETPFDVWMDIMTRKTAAHRVVAPDMFDFRRVNRPMKSIDVA